VSALGRAALVVLALVAWRTAAVPALEERWERARASTAPPRGAGTVNQNWSDPLGALLGPELLREGQRLAAELPPAAPRPGADRAIEPELVALAAALIEREGLGGTRTSPVVAATEGGDPWRGVEPRARPRLLRALVEAGKLDAPTRATVLTAVLAHLADIRAADAAK
jgi:hypothetical protein